MTVLIILAAFCLAVWLLTHLIVKAERAKAQLELVVNVFVVAGLVLAALACFGVIVIPALQR